MRHILAAVSVLFAGAIVACSSSPSPETSNSTSQALGCPAGEGLTCYDGAHGPVCTCAPISCHYEYSAPPGVTGPEPGYAIYVETWAVASPSGLCPTIPTPGGTWAELGQPAGGNTGVPGETSGTPARTCSEVISGPCCTYVWWPPAGNTGPQRPDPHYLCASSNATVWGLDRSECVGGGNVTCPIPGGGGCGACIGRTTFP
jgi:hypothetical protein